MKLIRSALWSSNALLSRRFQSPHLIRAFSANPFSVSDDWDNLNSSGPINDSEQGNAGDGIFEERSSGDGIFGQKSSGNGGFEQPSSGDGRLSGLNSFYEKLGKAEKARGMGSLFNMGNRSGGLNGLDENYNSLFDGMEYKLKKAASYFDFDPVEVTRDDYTFRPDFNFNSGMTYDTKDLDLRKPGARRPVKRFEFETTTKEVLEKADFRNVKFLANFITEAGIIIKRSQTGISAKAQRRIAREIKTARAFGLMPFIAMGTKRFEYGKTMEHEDADFEFEVSNSYDTNFVDEDRGDPMDT
ncbi:hypothetical protein ACS0TY_036863 [Phlomoides rotata]